MGRRALDPEPVQRERVLLATAGVVQLYVFPAGLLWVHELPDPVAALGALWLPVRSLVVAGVRFAWILSLIAMILLPVAHFLGSPTEDQMGFGLLLLIALVLCCLIGGRRGLAPRGKR